MAANAEPLEAREPSHSGRLLLRMPRALHAELAKRSDAEGVSLNQFIVAALSRAASGEEPAGDSAPRPMSSTLRIALIVNAVVVAIAAATAIVLLVVAWN